MQSPQEMREEFDKEFGGFIDPEDVYSWDVKKEIIDFWLQKLLERDEALLAIVEETKIKVPTEDELAKRDGYNDPDLQNQEIEYAIGHNSALSELKEKISNGKGNTH